MPNANPVIELLGSDLRRPDGATIPTSEAVSNKKVLGLYFSAHWCPPCRGFTPQLSEKYTALKDAGKDFELVFVSSDKDEASFNDYHNEMTFLALPFSKRDEKAKLSKLFKVSGIPTLVFVDVATGDLITDDGRSEISSEKYIENFPYKPKTLEEILEAVKTLRKPDGTTVEAKEALSKPVLGFYFSAHWCPPCRGFTPTLSEKYKALKDAGKDFELIFVSSDQDASAYESYHNEMSFLSLPYELREEKSALSTLFKVSGIPSLVFVDENKKLITDEGRGGISSKTFIEDFPYYPKPVNDLAENANGINANASLILLMEAASTEEQQKLTKELLEIAKTEQAKPNPSIPLFFTACTSGGPTGQIRSNCGFEAVVTPHEHKLDKADASAGGWYCDGCSESGEERFRCGERCDFDFCGKCNEKSSKGATAPAAMLILDLDDDGAYYKPKEADATVTAESIRDFMRAFEAKELTKKTWGS